MKHIKVMMIGTTFDGDGRDEEIDRAADLLREAMQHGQVARFENLFRSDLSKMAVTMAGKHIVAVTVTPKKEV